MKKIIILTVLLSLAKFSLSCKCCAYLGEQNADLVFSGEVMKIKKGSRWNVVTIETSKTYKGDVKHRIKIKTRSTTGACGYGFKLNDKYLLYCNRKPMSRLRVSRCSHTENITGKSESEIEVKKGSNCDF